MASSAETCDSLLSVQVLHSLAGGTGSGTGSLLLTALKDRYPEISIVSWPMLPRAVLGEPPASIYNTILALPTLTNSCHLAMPLSVDSFLSSCSHRQQITRPTCALPTLKELNSLLLVRT